LILLRALFTYRWRANIIDQALRSAEVAVSAEFRDDSMAGYALTTFLIASLSTYTAYCLQANMIPVFHVLQAYNIAA
jgi:hypothetical protein